MPKYTFCTTHFVPTGNHTYKCTSFEVEAEDAEKAYEQVLPQFPDGSRLFCWYSNEPFQEDPEEVA
jgi:hypothetical protein